VHKESTVLDADDTNPTNPPAAGGVPPEAPTAEGPVKKAAAKKAAKTPAKKAAAKKTTKKAAAKKSAPAAEAENAPAEGTGPASASGADEPARKTSRRSAKAADSAPALLFQAPEATAAPRKRAAKATAEAPPEAPPADAEPSDAGPEKTTEKTPEKTAEQKPAKKTAKKAAKKTAKKTATKAATDEVGSTGSTTAADDAASPAATDEHVTTDDGDSESGEGGPRRRRRRGGRRRGRKGGSEDNGHSSDNGHASDNGDEAGPAAEGTDAEDEGGEESGTRRRRTRVRKPRNPEDEITSVSGSTRLEAKKQRRREGREAGRRRAPIVSEAEFLARRESVDRVMVVRQRDDLTQIGVLEDKVLVEHYVARESQTSLIGNIYLGRVQNVLPSMEAAFVDIGKGRNAVLYAGEVNWSALGHKDGQPRKVESVLKSGQTILVQVTKDPIGHKGARLTGQISLPGRFLVYVPDGNTSGISRKLPDTERHRLKTLLKEIVPDTAGVIVRTAAEGASEDELTQDVERLTARWADIEKKVEAGNSPELLYGEPDLTLKVVRDLFTEDFSKLVIQGDDAWELVDGYVSHVAPDLRDRLERFEPGADSKDVFAAYRIDEQIAKGLDRKVWLPSGGSLVIDRTEAMTVVDVNTGKFTGSGGNLEETVTKNNLEAAEEVVRQLRLRDIGGIIVIDFIDMVLESNRDLVLRRLVECLGRDRTRHQVAEVTSLGLVQMTRKRIGTGLLEAFGEECEHCKGRGVIVHEHPVESGGRSAGDEGRGRRNRGGGRSRGRSGGEPAHAPEPVKPSPMALAGTKPHPEPRPESIVAKEEESALLPDPLTVPEPGAAAEPVAPVEVTWSVAVPVEGTVTAPVEATVEGTADAQSTTEAAAQETPAPVVVTSTRRRRAGRPAGPAVAVPDPDAGTPDTQADAATPAADDDDREAAAIEPDNVEPADGESAGGESVDGEHGPSLLHVPVKKKGSRKR
jgi:ribonuclease E